MRVSADAAETLPRAPRRLRHPPGWPAWQRVSHGASSRAAQAYTCQPEVPWLLLRLSDPLSDVGTVGRGCPWRVAKAWFKVSLMYVHHFPWNLMHNAYALTQRNCVIYDFSPVEIQFCFTQWVNEKEKVVIPQEGGHLQQRTSCQGWHLIKGEGVCSALTPDINQRVTVHKGYIQIWVRRHWSTDPLEIRSPFRHYVNIADHLALSNAPSEPCSTLILYADMKSELGWVKKGLIEYKSYG